MTSTSPSTNLSTVIFPSSTPTSLATFSANVVFAFPLKIFRPLIFGCLPTVGGRGYFICSSGSVSLWPEWRLVSRKNIPLTRHPLAAASVIRNLSRWPTRRPNMFLQMSNLVLDLCL
ncbi:unnamed protein product [Albugo candida]|uniref:Uncharacterized protein n=1 Tax=Albugo candida TaxID=65357 RepID=A0A024GPV4_9STRA|nr:unnamed protein product [Albugo candida]|eukprot:CCI48824.1 unnamed protein product [Albugo candida]